MKAMSIKNPFASLIAMEYKTIETRVASSSLAKTKHRGEVLICVSRIPHQYWQDIMKQYHFNTENEIDPYLKKACDKIWIESGKNFSDFSSLVMNEYRTDKSMAIATANLVDIVPMTPDHQEAACCSIYPTAKSIMLDNIKMIVPFDITGLTNGFHLGLFDVNLKQPIQSI